MHLFQRRRFISLVLAALAALAIPAMPAAPDNPRSITVMTQNIYQGTALPTDDLVLSNRESVDFAAASSIPTLAGPFSVGGGWLSVDAKVRGKTLRFVTAHMDPFSPAIRNAQAQQILTTAGAAGLPL